MESDDAWHLSEPVAIASTEACLQNQHKREPDRMMPIANVIRIMRKVMPPHAKIADDAKETIQECVSEFISFVTSEANDRCQAEQRKTITSEDILWAMSKLGFEDYTQPLAVFLARYRDIEGDHRVAIRGDSLVRTTAVVPASHMGKKPNHDFATSTSGYVKVPRLSNEDACYEVGGRHG